MEATPIQNTSVVGEHVHAYTVDLPRDAGSYASERLADRQQGAGTDPAMPDGSVVGSKYGGVGLYGM